MKVSKLVGEWYDSEKRNLPWRKTSNPYKIWISEVILQQTRVQQGVDFYYRFIDTFPDVNNLAISSLDNVLKLWQGLGYYARARNLHRAAKKIIDVHNGIFPSEYSDIKNLPGIGIYTAAAIASIAFGKPYAAVDGNVARVLSRLFGIEERPDTITGKKKYQDIANDTLDKRNPGRHNQAMIELGALVCLPRNPLCQLCPLQNQCYAKKNNYIPLLPPKKPRTETTDRYFYYVVFYYTSHIYLQQRSNRDIWELLYEFPLIESNQEISKEELLKIIIDEFKLRSTILNVLKISKRYKHQLTHQTIYARFIKIKLYKKLDAKKFKLVPFAEINSYAVPRLIDKYIHDEPLLLPS
ncbi:MAG: A/G-specific adenine glycosylase [Bacteroidales bacterium]|nr:A/G-specific adenine glycosylase [Bacteroidales bacterium]